MRAIQTFKDHFLTILAGTAPTFSKDRWDLLLPQAELMLNLLRPSNNPSLMAWHSLFGPFNFSATPMGPAGCHVLIHMKAAVWKLWENHCHEGFYIGPALQHYCCYRVLNKLTGAVTISDAINFWHHYLQEPTLSLEDKLLHAMQAIQHTLARSTPRSTDKQLMAIATLKAILHSYNHAVQMPSRPVVPAITTLEQQMTMPEQQTTLPPAPGVPGAPPMLHMDIRWITVTRKHRSANVEIPLCTTPPEPVAARTWARSKNTFAMLQRWNCGRQHCQKEYSNIPILNIATPVIKLITGQELEHRQLRKHPDYKDTWDASYANELGRLCQGVGTNKDDPTKQWVQGTNTFQPIYYHDIPLEWQADITYTCMVCDIERRSQSDTSHHRRKPRLLPRWYRN
jgi:hypothetical protein